MALALIADLYPVVPALESKEDALDTDLPGSTYLNTVSFK
jgi:hypothetical protein